MPTIRTASCVGVASAEHGASRAQASAKACLIMGTRARPRASRVLGEAMNRSGLVRLAFVLVALAAPLHAQNALEIITLRHRTAEQVLPALRPLLEPGATLTGQS